VTRNRVRLVTRITQRGAVLKAYLATPASPLPLMHLTRTPGNRTAAVCAFEFVPFENLPADGFYYCGPKHISTAQRAARFYRLHAVLEDADGKARITDFCPAHSWHLSTRHRYLGQVGERPVL
jgi:hypothetical protein